MLRRPLRPIPSGPLAGLLAVTLLAPIAAEASPSRKLVGPVASAFAAVRRVQPNVSEELPAAIRLVARPDGEAVAALERAGATVLRRRDGQLRGAGRDVAVRLSESALERVVELAVVEAVYLDGSVLGHVAPLDVTGPEVEAPAVWNTFTDQNVNVRGEGVTLCNIDGGIDVFHPLFFRPDGGYFPWIDVDGDGVFSPGIDGVDIDADGVVEVVSHVDAGIEVSSNVTEPAEPGYQPSVDWLFIDENGNGARDQGLSAGFTEASPTYGERWLVGDDVDDNGILDVGERVVALGTSKIKSVMWGNVIHRRGENLIGVPTSNARHSTTVVGALAGGTPGLNRYVGLAPDAEIVVGAFGNGFVGELALGDFCVEEGARVVVHEYAPWFSHFLDGSSPMESFIDTTSAQGVTHINPVGNLAGSDKQYKRDHPSGERSTLEVDNPSAGYEGMVLTVLWRDPSRPLSFELELADGQTTTIPGGLGSQTLSLTNTNVFVNRADSDRGTAMLDVQVFSNAGLAPGTIQLHVDDGAPTTAPPLTVIAYVTDEQASWSSGMHFAEHASEDHLLCYPSTADAAIAVAAYVGSGHKGGVPGQLASSSSRGRRIDGLALMSVAAPNDPVTALAGSIGGYRVFGGTSGAAPHVAAGAALLLQREPSLDGGQVRDALRQSALVDEAVGVAPNDDFGYGKLRIHQALYGAPPPAGAAPTIAVVDAALTVGEVGRVTLAIDGAETVELDRDYDGVYDETIDVDGFDALIEEVGITLSLIHI